MTRRQVSLILDERLLGLFVPPAGELLSAICTPRSHRRWFPRVLARPFQRPTDITLPTHRQHFIQYAAHVEKGEVAHRLASACAARLTRDRERASDALPAVDVREAAIGHLQEERHSGG